MGLRQLAENHRQGVAPDCDRIADSDSLIVAGVIAVLKVLFQGCTAADAAALDVRQALARLCLERHLSPQRRNGLYGIVRRIQDFAREAAG